MTAEPLYAVGPAKLSDNIYMVFVASWGMTTGFSLAHLWSSTTPVLVVCGIFASIAVTLVALLSASPSFFFCLGYTLLNELPIFSGRLANYWHSTWASTVGILATGACGWVIHFTVVPSTWSWIGLAAIGLLLIPIARLLMDQWD